MSDEKRSYRKRRRAELEEETRRRITESAMALHGTLGPARTSVIAIAEHAGVRRSTVYRHFPDEEALFQACSTHWRAANPTPDLAEWSRITDPDERLRTGLGQLYAHYRRTEPMMTCLLRDEKMVPVLGKTIGGYRHYLTEAKMTLLAGRRLDGRAGKFVVATIGHALAFSTWRSLAIEQKLSEPDCVEAVCQTVAAVARIER